MSEAIDRMLERVARECGSAVIDAYGERDINEACFVALERELKPLLEGAFELSRELESPIRDVGMITIRREQLRAAIVRLVSNERPAERGKGNE